MRFIPARELNPCKFEQHESFFLECWYGLTHMRSLDSYRASCLNARTVAREINEELEIGRLDDPEFRGLCGEACQTLKLDSIVRTAFPNSLKILIPLLEQPPSLPGASRKGKDEKEADNQTRLRELRFAIGDISALLEARYLDGLCDTIVATIAAHRTDALDELANSLVSDLVDRGWPLQSLNFWYRHFIVQKDRTFQQNLEFMLRQFRLPPQDFEVTLRINSATKLKKLDEFGPFKLSRSSGDIEAKTPTEKKFASSDNYVVFAKGTVQGVDAVSAAIAGRDKFESLLDVACFEFLRTTLKIDERTYVVRCADRRPGLPLIENPVPNPVEAFDENDFKTFSEKLTIVLESTTLDPEAKNRVRTAFRQYRFGRDCQNYADKVLNWWMGLETLAKVDSDKIGRSVTRNISYAMLSGYLARIMRDLLVTFQHLVPAWHDDFTSVCGVCSWDGLDVAGLLKLIQDKKQLGTLSTVLGDRPMVAFQTRALADFLSEPKKTAAQLEAHMQRLQWHIDRLFRIRCCIVHGSPVRFRLALFAAALEYYLKQSLIFVLNGLHTHRHITDLAGLFHRCVVLWDRRIKELNATGAKVHTISEAVFTDIVLNN